MGIKRPGLHGEDHVNGVDPITGLLDHVVFSDLDLQGDDFLYFRATGTVSVGDLFGIHLVADEGMLLETGSGATRAALQLFNSAGVGTIFGQASGIVFEAETNGFVVVDPGNHHAYFQVDADGTTHMFQFIGATWTETFRWDPDGTVHGLTSVGAIAWDL